MSPWIDAGSHSGRFATGAKTDRENAAESGKDSEREQADLDIVKLPKMSRAEISELIHSQRICRIVFGGTKYPYIAPFQYVVKNGSLYFHFTGYGRKIRYLGKKQRVCVQIENLSPDLSNYRFMVMRGKLDIVENEDERKEIVQRLAQEGEQKLSKNFLAAHGLRKEEGWAALAERRNAIVVRLVDIVEEIGLKSP